ncbi:histidine phosphatase family protein [Vibrio sp. FNV 38]|nr:histidine phosphatase family protein [Vibrio sp. FNV 38]
MANIYLMRHGKVLGEPALYGHTDVRVADDAQRELADLVVSKLGFKHIVTSPLIRCADLATQVCHLDSTVSLNVHPNFKEMSFGQFDGVPFTQLDQQRSLLDAFYDSPAEVTLPDAETLAVFNRRVIEEWKTFVHNVEEDTLCILHGGVIRIILAHVLNIDWRKPELFSRLQISNGSISHLEVFPDFEGWVTIKMIGCPLT